MADLERYLTLKISTAMVEEGLYPEVCRMLCEILSYYRELSKAVQKEVVSDVRKVFGGLSEMKLSRSLQSAEALYCCLLCSKIQKRRGKNEVRKAAKEFVRERKSTSLPVPVHDGVDLSARLGGDTFGWTLALLDHRELVNCELVSKEWARFCKQSSAWQNKLERTRDVLFQTNSSLYGKPFKVQGTTEEGYINWKAHFKNVYQKQRWDALLCRDTAWCTVCDCFVFVKELGRKGCTGRTTHSCIPVDKVSLKLYLVEGVHPVDPHKGS